MNETCSTVFGCNCCTCTFVSFQPQVVGEWRQRRNVAASWPGRPTYFRRL